MEIIVLKTTNYKEKDSILEGLSEDGTHSFLVRGLLTPKCSNIILANNLILADIEIQEGKYKHPIVKKSKLIASPYHIENQLDAMSALSLINEITLHLLQEDERAALFPWLKSAIIYFQNESIDPLSIALTYFMKVIKESGYSFEVNQCVRCGAKKNIVAFSFTDGGFICKSCLTDEISRNLSNEAMLAIRKAVNLNEYKDIEGLTHDIFNEILRELKVFILDYLGVRLTSTDLFI